MGRCVPEGIASGIEAVHRQHGVEFHFGVCVNSIVGDDTSITLLLENGALVDADFCAIGIGVIPNTELAEAAGLEVDDGIMVDHQSRSSDAHIWAAGDVTRRLDPISGRIVRQENWKNAEHQAEVAVHGMLDLLPPASQVPWFWSDQYDLNLQVYGLPESWDGGIWRPSERSDQSLLVLAHGDQVEAAAGINVPRDMAMLRDIIGKRRRIDASLVADATKRPTQWIKP
jgi:NADPH-dependent 2,4-dienoyl-CoA reductase/sulfur reductase-like enzyme